MHLWACILTLTLTLSAVPQTAKGQFAEQQTLHGWNIAPYGRLHIMVVFAEMEFDSGYAKLDPVKKPEGSWKWKSGKMPTWEKDLIAPEPGGDAWMTNYFRQASFGKFQVTGDYLDQVIRVKISEVRDSRGKIVTQEPFGNRHYKQALLRKVNAIENPKFAFGSKLEDFDRWGRGRAGMPKEETPNGRTDLIMIVWRNIHVHNLGNMSGFVTPGDFGNVFGRSTDMYSIFVTHCFLPRVIMRHEFSHMLYGGNNFHTANGGVGSRTWMPTVGGWSNMSGSDACSPTWNAWDRERMGWQNPDNAFLLSTRCARDRREVDGRMAYGEALCNDGEYILRDFASTGDAIRIKLPHLPDNIKQQYLWLENHQRREGMIDHDKAMVKGLYAYITAGKDLLTGAKAFSGENNYLWPLVGHGSYDFGFSKEAGDALLLDSDRQNPFTGYTYLMRIMDDIDQDGKLRITTDVRPRTEYHLPRKLVVDGDTMPKEYFSYQTYPIFGTKDVAFNAAKHPKIGLSHNPAATPLYTFSGPRGPTAADNRRIYLNGISVEVLGTDARGDMRIKIRWDDYDVVQDVRWCGDILSKETLRIQSGVNVVLDQGYSPQVSVAVQTIDGKQVFAEPTVMELDSESLLEIQSRGSLRVRKGSTLIIRAGARVNIADRGSIVVSPGGYLYIEEGADIRLQGRNAKIQLQGDAKSGIHPMHLATYEGIGPAVEVGSL